MKFKALILDAGGVMVKPLHGVWNIPADYQRILGDYAEEVGSDKWKAALNKNETIIREDLLMPRDLVKEYLARRDFLIAMAEDMEWTLTDAQISNLTLDFTDNPQRYIWYDDVNPYLKKWSARYKLGMLSDAMPSFRSFTASHGADVYFDSIVLSTDIGYIKPHPNMYHEIADDLLLWPEECVFVDDKEHNVVGALTAGMFAIQMDRTGKAKCWNGDVAHDFEELDRILRRLEEEN